MILSFLGVEMLLEGLDKAKVLVIATYIEEIISIVVAIGMISGLYLKTKRGENAAKAA